MFLFHIRNRAGCLSLMAVCLSVRDGTGWLAGVEIRERGTNLEATTIKWWKSVAACHDPYYHRHHQNVILQWNGLTLNWSWRNPTFSNKICTENFYVWGQKKYLRALQIWRPRAKVCAALWNFCLFQPLLTSTYKNWSHDWQWPSPHYWDPESIFPWLFFWLYSALRCSLFSLCFPFPLQI